MTRDRAWVVHRYARVTSTMDVAAHLARFGAPDRTAIISAEQTAGRGRGGRSWQAPPGAALICTLLLRPPIAPDRLSTLPLIAGVAVAEAIEQETGYAVQLKWPNDVWIGADPERRKVAGILVTSSLQGGAVDHVLIGIGINVSGHHNELPPGATSIVAANTAHRATGVILSASEESRFDTIARDLQTRSFVPQCGDTEGVSSRRRRDLGSRPRPSAVSRDSSRPLGMTLSPCHSTQDDPTSDRHPMNDLSPDTLFERLLDRFDRAYEEFLAAQGRPSLAGWLARAALLGELVAIEDAGRQYSGAFLGVDDDGALLLQEPDATIRKVVAGDVTRGPRAVPQLG